MGNPCPQAPVPLRKTVLSRRPYNEADSTPGTLGGGVSAPWPLFLWPEVDQAPAPGDVFPLQAQHPTWLQVILGPPHRPGLEVLGPPVFLAHLRGAIPRGPLAVVPPLLLGCVSFRPVTCLLPLLQVRSAVAKIHPSRRCPRCHLLPILPAALRRAGGVQRVHSTPFIS